MTWVDDTLMVRGKEIPIRRGFLRHEEVKFFADNPRIYSVVRADGQLPEQDQIEKKLLGMEHVKSLIQDIKANGGLIDPIIVKDGTLEVLEGNSRLAAYRALAKKDPIAWGKIKCCVLPETIEEADVFSILGQYHIKGKKDWAPYEQAGFLYRRNKQHNISVTELGEELGIGRTKASQLIHTYQFMVDHDDRETSHWSYYEEYIKSNKIKKLRDEYSNLDELIVGQVKTGAIMKAVDIRDKLPSVSSAAKKIKNQFTSGSITLDEAYKRAQESGVTDQSLLRVKRFKAWLMDGETQSAITASSDSTQQKIAFELGKIKNQCSILHRKLVK